MSITKHWHRDVFRPWSYQTCEVWDRSDILWLSNNNLYSHGETSNFVTPPLTRPLAKTQALRNLRSQRRFD